MPGKGKAPTSGNNLKQRVVALAQNLGLQANTEVKAARRLWGPTRFIDVVLTDTKSGICISR